jgi:hypothetical protein
MLVALRRSTAVADSTWASRTLRAAVTAAEVCALTAPLQLQRPRDHSAAYVNVTTTIAKRVGM